MDLPVSYFVFHLSLLTMKVVNLMVHVMGLLCVTKIVCNFHTGYFDSRGAFWHNAVHTMYSSWTKIVCNFHTGYFDYRGVFLIRTIVQQVEPSWQGSAMDTSLFRRQLMGTAA